MNWAGHQVVELEAEARISPNAIAAAFSKALNRIVKAEIVPRGDFSDPKFFALAVPAAPTAHFAFQGLL